jgi:hypothetical protein
MDKQEAWVMKGDGQEQFFDIPFVIHQVAQAGGMIRLQSLRPHLA